MKKERGEVEDAADGEEVRRGRGLERAQLRLESAARAALVRASIAPGAAGSRRTAA
jgi:hypothetical protein